MATTQQLPVSRVVNVTVSLAAASAALRNFGSCLILGTADVIDTAERLRSYASIDDVAADFGTSALEYQAAALFFSQSPTPTTVYLGRWAKSATSGRLKGRMLSVAEQAMPNFTGVTEGSVSFTIDGVVKTASAINLKNESNLNGVASQIAAGLGGSATCTWDGTRFIVTSASTGSSSSVICSDTGDLSSLLGFAGSTSAVKGVEAESLTDALSDLLGYSSWYACTVAATATDDEVLQAAALIEAASPTRTIGFTTQSTAELDSSQTTLGDRLKAAGYTRTTLLYSSSSPVAEASLEGRKATVDFEGSGTTITLMFKQLPGVSPEYLKTTQADALANRNINVLAAYQTDTSILQYGRTCGGWYIDEVHGLDWLQNRVQTDLWNLLYTTTTKIGQTDAGATTLVNCVNASLEQGVRNGLIAQNGQWNGTGFGALSKGDTLPSGYYVYIQPMAEQSQSERDARKAPPIQIAVKLAGAIHTVDVSITVNR